MTKSFFAYISKDISFFFFRLFRSFSPALRLPSLAAARPSVPKRRPAVWSRSQWLCKKKPVTFCVLVSVLCFGFGLELGFGLFGVHFC